MRNLPLELLCCGADPTLLGLLKPYLEQTSAALGLIADFSVINLILDDIQGCDEPWLHFHGSTDSDTKPHLEMYLHSQIFSKTPGTDSSVFPHSEVWERQEAPRQAIVFAIEHFRREFCLNYLHHHLLTARDIARKELVPGRIPRNRADNYQVCWAVTVDGRLEKWGLPGFDLPERRRYFSRHFSQAGVLMPSHWNIFQALWDGGISGQGAVLEAVGGLPHL